MSQAKDALLSSVPLEQSPGKLSPPPDPEPAPDWGEGVKPVADIPLGSPPPEAQLPAHEPALMTPIREFTPDPDWSPTRSRSRGMDDDCWRTGSPTTPPPTSRSSCTCQLREPGRTMPT